ncbi:Krueppel homolog 1 [Teleopsis dalmanni]|uniref:Krueppel homolog 1 n=1 Tax=Teleopsis dalmanni TaxID=139649 RepID=UPI0018CEB547|nr:Krueppel homolog 1 [Teleopsis dalmanni]XP_037957876.1 Krueppel homolog 1 [Teleopsis dalmanni]
MVYYQSTPLIIKSEQPSQAQFCSPLQSTPNTVSTVSTQLQTTPHNYTINDNNGCAIVLQQQQSTQASIINGQTQNFSESNSSYLTNIKTEVRSPQISFYTTTTTAAAAATTSSTQGHPSSVANLLPQSTQIITDNCIISNNTNSENPRSIFSNNSVEVIPTKPGRKSSANKPQFKCEQCGMTFGSKSAHTSHTKSHAKNLELIISGNGGAGDITESGLLLGIPKTPQIKPYPNGVIGADPYQCNVCHKTFAVPARLIRHYRTHTGERPFECEFCHKLFSVKENLQVHRRIHTKERPYKCDVCGRAFEHSGKLHRHMRIHTGERPHKCSVCEKTFIQSGQLVIHMRTHTGEKPYKCPVEGCGKGFTCSKQLKVHSRTHTGEKPYHCDICFRDFGYNHVLKLHRVQHYGSKCYKCTICDETFKNKKEMEAHIKGHANELPDEEEEDIRSSSDTHKNVPQRSSSRSSSVECSSEPGSPQSMKSNTVVGKVKKTKQSRSKINDNGAIALSKEPLSPSSPSSTLSSTSSLASVSRLSAGSPVSSVASPTMPNNYETDHQSHDSSVAGTSNNRQFLSTTKFSIRTGNTDSYNNALEVPTDLSVPHQLQTQQTTNYYEQQILNNSYVRLSPVLPIAQNQSHYQIHISQNNPVGAPTINPALLEAASIASSRDMLEPREEDVTQAALQIMQLHRSQKQHHQALLINQDLTQYDDTHEDTELIEHYKRGEFTRHGFNNRYAPVPKFESSLLNNEIIVRQVEAAIAPLRSSTESPERSSSPESDSMMMADRDIMTLPLRKRKLYMNEDPTEAAMALEAQQNHKLQSHTRKSINNSDPDINNINISNGTANNSENGIKVMRMSSVIQFAKAS